MSAELHSRFQLGPDETPYRKLTSEGVRIETAFGREILAVEPQALRRLAEQAMFDINHLLRPGHLAQLARILDDPEATANDKFVAYDLLKNANIAAGGVLPMCQDTGTAIVVREEGPQCLDRRRGRGGDRRGNPRRLSKRTTCATARSRRSPCSRRGTPATICPRRSISTPRARTPISSCSWPRAAARPTRPSSIRRRLRY